MKKNCVLNFAYPTPGDEDFYTRWNKIGPVFQYVDNPKNWKRITVLVVDHRINVTDNLLQKMPNLKYIVSATTGHTHIKCDLQKTELLSLRGETKFLNDVKSVAEFTMMLILAISRPVGTIGHVLNGKTLGIIGYGRIGKHLSKIAKSFGMTIKTIDKNDSRLQWRKVFRSSDYISIHLPENEDTYKIVDKQLIGIMPLNSYFINTARGSVVDEHAISKAIHEEDIAGGAFDVWEDEDLINDSLPNTLITPHTAGNTMEDRIKTDTFMRDKLFHRISKQEYC